MINERTLLEIRSRWKEIYPRDKCGKGIICPICGNGTGTSGDGIRENPNGKVGALKCFKCGFSGDVIDLIQQDTNNSANTFAEAAKYAADILNIQLDEQESDYLPVKRDIRPQNERNEKRNTETRGNENDAENALKIDYTAYCRECTERITAPEAVSYLSARGISIENAKAAGIGFDPAADPAGNGHTAPRIIIPVTNSFYIGRAIDPAEKVRYMNTKTESGIFNAGALFEENAKILFVTEGAFDALAVREAGADAIALNSTSNYRKLLDLLKDRRTNATIALCLDNDRAGEEATAKLRDGLKQLNISTLEATKAVCGKFKDPAEALTGDRSSFVDAVQRIYVKDAARPDNTLDYLENLMSADIEIFKDGCNAKTGFPNLDKAAGGVFPGLYILAAGSSLGKTTFCGQLADQFAEQGRDVIFFSLEQSRLDIMAKSLSRLTALQDYRNAETETDIKKGVYSDNLREAQESYKRNIGNRITVLEGNFNCDIAFIGDYIRRYIERTGVKPVIILDYLQLIQPEKGNTRQTLRETVDANVTTLKRMSRDLSLTIFAISSVNRSNYEYEFDFSSLKESGTVEYTGDVVWGLQLQAIHDKIFSGSDTNAKRKKMKAAKREQPRRMELCCLKNRFGKPDFSVYFEYDSAHNLFRPGTLADEYKNSDYEEPPKAGRKLDNAYTK